MSRILATISVMVLVGGLSGGFAASSDPSTPVSEEAVPPGTWQLRAIVYADGGEVVPAHPANYTIAFFPGGRSITYSDSAGHEDPDDAPDGRIGLQLDCNVGSADYLVDGNRLAITTVVSTNQGCLPPTVGGEFAERFWGVTSYALNGDDLVLFLAGGGRMRFARPGAATPAASGRATRPVSVEIPTACGLGPLPALGLGTRLNSHGDRPRATPSPTMTIPLGREAPADTAAEISGAVSGYLGCLNAGDVSRAAVFLTDNGVRRLFGDGAALRRNRGAALVATPAVLSPQARTRMIALTDIVLLADGRAAAVALVNDPLSLPKGRQAVLLYFVRERDQWLIDDVLSFSVPATPAVGTPTP